MKRKGEFPDIPTGALRDHGTEERVERVWRRLESDLQSGPSRPRAALWWAPAAVLIVFGSGVVVGARWGQSEPPVSATTVQPEPPGPSEEPAGLPERELPVLPLEAEPEDRQKQPRAPAPLPVEAPETASLPELLSPVVAPQSAPPAIPEWYRLAQEDFKKARIAVERAGGFSAVIPTATADQLMTLADIARDAGQPVHAIQAFRRVVEQFPNDPNASVAAYSLGTLLEKSGDRAGASKAFAAYRSLSPKGDFAEDALARQVEVAIEQGNVELARQLADQYAKDFPNGRRLGEIRAQIAKLTGQPAAAPSSAGGSPGAAPSEEEAPSEEPEEAPPAAP